MISEIEKARVRINAAVADMCRRAGCDPSTYYYARRKEGRQMEADTMKALVTALEEIEAEQREDAARVARIGITANQTRRVA